MAEKIAKMWLKSWLRIAENGRNSFLGIDEKMFEKMSLDLKERIGRREEEDGIESMTWKWQEEMSVEDMTEQNRHGWKIDFPLIM